MDRRSWLWRKKSSEKSPGETESSGSISSHSEMFSDDQAYPNHSTQSPEVTSKVASGDEESDRVKSLAKKLSAALLNISAKEELVKQHAKVAEEAVSGWENAENEVLSLKHQLEVATQKNSTLGDRVGHLDGALKECVKQLRKAREEQEQKVHEAVAKKTREWDLAKSELEEQLVELQAQLQSANAEAAASTDPDLGPKLQAVEKENASLKLELISRAEELDIRIIERDLSTQAAETASKQHLESIKKVAKLEAECRKLKAMALKASPANDKKYFSSSVYIESVTESESDSGERLMAVETNAHKIGGLELNECEPVRSDSWAPVLITELNRYKNDKSSSQNFMVPLADINLMDDFLEMERLAGLPEIEAGAVLDQPNSEESMLKADIEALIQRTADLEEKLERMEAEKVEMEMVVTECQRQLGLSHNQLKETEMKLVELQITLTRANESKQAAHEKVQSINTKREAAESRVRSVEAEIRMLLLKVGSLEENMENERALSDEKVAKCRKLENELFRMRQDAELRQAVTLNGELKMKKDKELAVAASKFAECQKTIASLGRQLKSLATLEDFLIDSDKTLEFNGERSQHPSVQQGEEHT